MGQLDILNTGEGHNRLEINEDDPQDIERAKHMIEDMLKRGYAIFIETSDGKTRRVKKFNKKRFTYLIGEQEEVSPAKSKATAVGRSSGG